MRITREEGEPLKTEGKIMVAPGWLEVYGREGGSDKPEENLPTVEQGQRVETVRVEFNTEQTRPPVRYNEGTILSAMEGAGKLVDDEELRDAMKEKGLGTPATRASIIETLISAHYLTRHGKELQPTAKAIQTIMLLKNAVPELTSPELTGEWEFRLREIEHRKLTRDAFMRDIRELTNDIVGKAKHFHPDEHMPDTEPFGACPKCGGRVFESGMSYVCENSVGPNKACDFRSGKVILQRSMEREQMKKLLETGRTDLLERFISRKGRPFKAFLVLTDKKDVGFEFEKREPKPKGER